MYILHVMQLMDAMCGMDMMDIQLLVDVLFALGVSLINTALNGCIVYGACNGHTVCNACNVSGCEGWIASDGCMA